MQYFVTHRTKAQTGHLQWTQNWHGAAMQTQVTAIPSHPSERALHQLRVLGTLSPVSEFYLGQIRNVLLHRVHLLLALPWKLAVLPQKLSIN